MIRLLILSLAFAAASAPVAAQQTANATASAIQVNASYVGTRANAPPGTCGCFWLQGAALDAAVPITARLSAAVEVAGTTVDRVPSSTRGLSEITLMAGPRYTLSAGRISVSGQAIFGAVHGFDSDFITGAKHFDTSTNFAFAAGGFLELPLSHAVRLRAVQIDLLQSNLPNGADNRQRNLRVGAGLTFRIPLPAAR